MKLFEDDFNRITNNMLASPKLIRKVCAAPKGTVF